MSEFKTVKKIFPEKYFSKLRKLERQKIKLNILLRKKNRRKCSKQKWQRLNETEVIQMSDSSRKYIQDMHDWQNQHQLAYWKSRALSLEAENHMLHEHIRKIYSEGWNNEISPSIFNSYEHKPHRECSHTQNFHKDQSYEDKSRENDYSHEHSPRNEQNRNRSSCERYFHDPNLHNSCSDKSRFEKCNPRSSTNIDNVNLTTSEEDNSGDENLQVKFVANETWLQFMEHTELHRRELRKQRESENKIQDSNKQTEMNEVNSDEKEFKTGKFNSEERSKEMKQLYGSGAAIITACEAAIQFTFEHHIKNLVPYWPNIPLKI